MRTSGPEHPIEVRVANSLESIDEHAEAWDRLTMASSERLPMLSHEWVSSFLEHATPAGAPWQCFFAYQGADLVGVLPLIRARGWVRDRLRGPADLHTEFAHPLLAA